MNLYQPNIVEDRGVHVLSFRRDELGIADLDQVRHYFAHTFLQDTGSFLRLVIDLAGVATLDSSCLGPLVQRLRLAQQHQGRLALCGVDSPALEEIFALTRFDKVFPIYKTRGEAVAALAG
jgi:anti-anti-sigma factor